MANESLTHPGGWNSSNLSQNNVIFILCVVAAVLHFHIWLQLFIHKAKFDLSFIFSLGYISTDIFLISFFFIQYGIRIRSWIPVTRLSCYFEAYSMLYFNLLELYCLTLLNICRYYQIVRNQNIYKFHRRKLIFITLILPLLILFNLIIQDVFGWYVVTEKIGASCSLSYTNSIVRIWNLIIVLTLPILTSSYLLVRTLYFIQNTHAQQAIMRRNHHRKLIIHSSIFYSIWLSLWLPSNIIIFLNANEVNDSAVFASVIANTLETLLDPFISFFLDQRFARVWKKFFQSIQHQFGCHMNAKVNPTRPVAVIHQAHSMSHEDI